MDLRHAHLVNDLSIGWCRDVGRVRTCRFRGRVIR
jgi:hypothetical protein